MNFMETGRGFYEGSSKCPLPFSQSSSSSSSRQKAPLGPYSYNHNQESCAHPPTELTMDSFRASGVDNDGDDSEDHHQFVIRGGEGGSGGGVGGGVGGGGESSGEMMEVIEREHMFDKVVTPSDVGKLNRLVIPKQQAEKYFPLDSSTNEKGLLLNFEDRNGKPWRFRYSYWKSSQSYVMTKGWSRFVKEKKLDAGDVVSFQRGVGEMAKDRLFIDWRRRRPDLHHYPHELPPPIPAFSLSNHFSLRPWNPHHHPYQHQHQHHPHLMQANYPVITPHQAHHFNSYGTPYNNSYGNANVYGPGMGMGMGTGSLVYLKSSGCIGGGSVGGGGGGGGGGPQQQVGLMQFQRGGVEGLRTMPIPSSMVYESVPVVQGKAAAKKLRLFGVNMECPITENNEHEILSSTTLPHFSTIHPSHNHRPNSSTPPLSLRPYFTHQTHPQRDFQENANDDKGKSSMSLDLDI